MVILLNGTSSSGKSSIVASLSNKLNDLYFVFSVDKFLEPAMPLRLNMDIPEHLKVIDRSISGFNQALAAYLKHTDYMIVDHVLQNPNWIQEVAKALINTDVFFVGVTAPLSIIEAREKERSDRQPGTARAQYEQMQKYEYDLVLDTSLMSSDSAAEEIIKNLRPGHSLKKYAR